MKKYQIILLTTCLSIAFVVGSGFMIRPDKNAVAEEAQAIKWVSIEEAAELASQDGKKIMVDLYTDWCGWCKRMDRDTYTNASIIQYINENYHAVKLNAEQKEDITVGGITYKYLPNVGRRGVHELAAKMLNGRLSYPSTVFFDHQLQILTNVPGYQSAGDMLPILSFLAEDAYKTTPWQEYQKNFKAGK